MDNENLKDVVEPVAGDGDKVCKDCGSAVCDTCGKCDCGYCEACTSDDCVCPVCGISGCHDHMHHHLHHDLMHPDMMLHKHKKSIMILGAGVAIGFAGLLMVQAMAPKKVKIINISRNKPSAYITENVDEASS